MGGELVDMAQVYTDIGKLARYECRLIQSYASKSQP